MTRLRRPVAASFTVAVAALAGLVLSTAPAGAAETGRYVALGDSYASAPLVPVQTGQPAGCLRSTHNYPSLVAKGLGITDVRDVTCGGATTKDMTSAQPVTGGSNPPQLDAVTVDAALVSVTIGGNDIGFGEIIQQCATRSPLKPTGSACKDFYTSGGTDQLAQRIEQTAPKIRAVLSGIADRAPDAKVVVVGYPAILPDSGPGCFPVVPFSPGDVAYLRSTEKALNAMIADEAGSAGAVFVDTYTPSIGHDVCQVPGTKWIEGLVPTAPAAPVHPNSLGTAGQAAAVLDTLGVRA
ncbi:SGNH/GDSL hydrolase family protein [Pseudonocardia sp. CA-107938]|uniref:SGNH/GDSL hydrolase family protein n=1 Tax=Pseudonocardia sp. CA-107938 TaxID=3240021 RepID=UPI003D8D3849